MKARPFLILSIAIISFAFLWFANAAIPATAADTAGAAGTENKRVLSRGVTISGHAFDVETKQPIPDFRVTPGIRHNPNLPEFIHWFKSLAVDGTNGNFDLMFPSKTHALILTAEADGYLPVQTEPLESGQTSYDFQLHKGSGPGGAVRQADGSPAAGVTAVYLAGQQQGRLDKKGELQVSPRGGQKMLTDANGQFHFAPQFGAGKIFAANSNGFGRMIPEQQQKDCAVILQPWARVHGRLVKDGKPVAAENVDLSWSALSTSDWPQLRLPGAVTDADGRFTIDFAPPGDLSLGTRIYTGSDRGNWTNQAQRDFTVKPGEDVDLGDVIRVAAKTVRASN